MAKLTIETSKAYAKELLKKLAEDKKVKSAYLSEPEVEYQRKLKPTDWVRPGRPATDEETDEFIKAREMEKGERPFAEFKEEMLKEMKTWREKK